MEEVEVEVGGDLLWAEPEVALVIGKRIFCASEQEAADAILGYTVINDATAPQFLLDGSGDVLPAPDFRRAKSVDTFCSLGPWIETDLCEEDFVRGVAIRGRVNGELVAEGNTRTAKFPAPVVAQYVSETIALDPGDVIAMGVPEPAVVNVGDVVEVEVEGIGAITNAYVAA